MKKNKFYLLLGILWLLAACASMEPSRPATVGSAPPAALEKIWDKPVSLFEAAKKYYQNGEYTFAQMALNRILEAYPKSEVYADAQNLAQEVSKFLGNTQAKIGVVLPLSGRFSRYGESILDGISCALGFFDPCAGSSMPVQIVVKDSRGNATVASNAIRELVEEEKVVAILGPLLSAETDVAAAQAQALHVPLIALSPKKGGTKDGDYIFQHALLIEDEMAFLLNKALKMGLNKFIVLYPKNRYGEQYLSLFTEELRRQGKGSLVGELGYEPDIPDFEGLLRNFTSEGNIDNTLRGTDAKRTGIFIPDGYEQALRIAQAFDQLSIRGARFIGTSRWYHPQLIRRQFDSLEGTLLDTPFFAEGKGNETENFTQSFYQAYGNQPAWLEALGYDAARMLVRAMQSSSGSPQEIRDSLKAIGSFPGAVGSISWDRERSSKWPLNFLTIKNGEFVPQH